MSGAQEYYDELILAREGLERAKNTLVETCTYIDNSNHAMDNVNGAIDELNDAIAIQNDKIEEIDLAGGPESIAREWYQEAKLDQAMNERKEP